MTVEETQADVGSLLRAWRVRRRLSQLALSIEAGVSSRHLSFVETGRARPSREMILQLADHLDVPNRQRNVLLLAGGYAPAYPDRGLDDDALAEARRAVRELLDAHTNYPAVVVDRLWNIVDTNAAVGVLTTGVAAHLLEPPVNALRLTLHPDGLASRIVNLAEWRGSVLGSLHRSAVARADGQMLALYDELAGYPGGDVDATEDTRVYVPLRLRTTDGEELSFLAMIATFGTAVDVTLSELAVELFFPADPATATYLHRAGAVPPA